MSDYTTRFTFVARVLAVLGLGACQRHTQQSSMGSMMSSMGTDQSMGGMMSSGRGRVEMTQMMGSADQADMQVYMEMFQHHQQIHRTVERLSNGVRTITESNNPRIRSLLQAHVSKMYEHVAAGQEVRCMSDSLPTMFRHSSQYQRMLSLTPHGVAVEETSDDPEVSGAIQRHADEVSAFVREGMPAMMRGMMP